MQGIRRWLAASIAAGCLVGGLGGAWALAASDSGPAMKHDSKKDASGGAMHEQGAAMSHDAAMSGAHLAG